jgi:transglutaminase-like putative cysteine protease
MTLEDTQTAAPRPSVRIGSRAWVDITVLSILSIIGIIGFTTAFQDQGWLLAGIGGLLLGTIAGIGAHLLRFGVLLTMLLAIIVFFVFGSAIAIPGQSLFGVIPTAESLASLTIGSVYGWADILTLRAPVSLPEYVTAVPYIATWLIGLVTATLAVRWLPRGRRTAWRAGLLLVGPVLLYVAGVLLGTEEPFFAAIRGITFAALALVWLGWRHSSSRQISAAGNRVLLRNKLVGTGSLVLAGILVGVFVGGALAPLPDNRFVLRDEVEPPFEPLNYPSPFNAYRKYTKALEQTVLFTVTGLEEGDRIRLATLDTYDGIVWGVAGSEVATDGSGAFSLVGREFPKPEYFTQGESSEITVTIEDYKDVWIPDIGYTSSLEFAGADAKADAAALRYNPATGTAVLTTGLEKGDSYTLTGNQQKVLTPEDIGDLPTESMSLPPVTNVPDVLVAKALEKAADATTPIEQLEKIKADLLTGYLSHGTGDSTVKSPAGHGASRLVDLIGLEPYVGDEEQYATAFALMARSFNYPARVVMGFEPEVAAGGGETKVYGSNVTAWVEVAFEGVGWVAFYPTPDDTDVPRDPNPKPQSEPQPQVRQPPRTENDPNDLVAGVEIDDSKKDDDWFLKIPGWVWTVAASILIPALLIFIPLLVIAALKGRRLARRRDAASGDLSAAGAWDELVDQFSELGYEIPQNTTRKGVASGLSAQVGEAGVALPTIAVRADEAVFSGEQVSPEASQVVWTEVLAAVEAARGAVSRLQRILSRYRVSSARAWLARLVAKAAAEAERIPRGSK